MPTITAARVVQIARGQIGTTESPASSNRQKYGAAFGWNGVSWCGEFVWWVFLEAGIDLRQHGVPGTEAASTNALDTRLPAAGWKRVKPADARGGDVVIYDFGITVPGDPANDADHTGIVSSQGSNGFIKAIEGNTSPGQAGSQANGGGVFERTRAYSLIKSVYRPPFAAWTPTPDAEEDEDMQPSDSHKLTAADVAAYGDPKLVPGKSVKSFDEIWRFPPGLARLRRELAARDTAMKAQLDTMTKAFQAMSSGSPAAVRAEFDNGIKRFDAAIEAKVKSIDISVTTDGD